MGTVSRNAREGLAVLMLVMGCTAPNDQYDRGSPRVDGPAAEVPPTQDAAAIPADVAIPTDTPIAADAAIPADAAIVADAAMLADAAGNAGPVLHWRMDEATIDTGAADSSGNGFAGTYVGEPTLPTPSTSVPWMVFDNPYSRAFPASGRPAIRLTSTTSQLGVQPSDALTFSVWYRAITAVTDGGELFNLDGAVFIRVKPTRIEFGKRRSSTSEANHAVAKYDPIGHLDGNWHHVAGVLSPSGMRLFLDGSLRGSDVDGLPFLPRGTELWMGRDPSALTRDFQGNLDDLRIYRRALTDGEILELAQGKR